VRKSRPTPSRRSFIEANSLIYGHADKRDAETAKGLTLDEARRIASNIAKLPNYVAASPEPEGAR
jgi:hypothetical protein